jgi:hypothetical protein
MPRARDNRLRTRVGNQLTELGSRVNGGKKKRKRKPARSVGDRLETTLTQIRGRGGRRRSGRFS